MDSEARVVVFVDVLHEFAELPGDGQFARWGAAVAWEAAFGIWRGHALRVLEVRGRRVTDDLWRDRSRDIRARMVGEELADDGLGSAAALDAPR
jgi:hypothetical protein